MHMSAEDIAHPAYAYLEAGITLIPITPGLKTPTGAWKEYQSRRSTPDEVTAWLRAEPRSNWAAVCGNGLACGDIDDLHAARWALEHPHDPVFQGACIVRSGRGKCHVWFRYTTHLASTTWRLLPGRKMGEVRAEGNYVLVPPSALAEREPYQRIAGSFVTLPVIVDPTLFLESIVQTYLRENPDQTGVEPAVSNKRILTLDAARADAVEQRVRLVGFKKKILDTLFVDGRQTPGQGHWERVDSNSEIDFAVCCEFIRKGWPFDDVEEVFASTRVGLACYRDTARANHGQGYLFRTYEASRKQVEEEARAARQAKGANFEVLQADLLDMGDQKHYTLVLGDPQGKRYTVRVNSKELRSETQFSDACAAQARFFPRFNANQLGRAFSLFAEAVDRTVIDISYPPDVLTDMGRLVSAIKDKIRHIPKRDAPPATSGEAYGLGWRVDNTYWIRLGMLCRSLENDRTITKNEGMQVRRALLAIGELHRERKVWPDSSSEEVGRLVVQPEGRPPIRVLPPSS